MTDHFPPLPPQPTPSASMPRDLSAVPPLSKGAHDTPNDGMCIMEAVAFVMGEPWSDHPNCVGPIIGAFLRAWNDALPDNERDALLRPLIPLIINTRASAVIEHRRSLLAADWLVRVHTPAWLRLSGLTKQADALASLPEITDMARCPSLMPTLEAVGADACAARDAAAAAAWAAAGEAAWNAAADAAWAATAAEAAAANAAWNAAGSWPWAADAAWKVAVAAAKTVACNAAAAREAAWDALTPTRLELQQSALALVHRMIATGDVA